ncbi:MAG: amidase, partial [Comamonas sp.]|nr:amidase [Comamonas sp.]
MYFDFTALRGALASGQLSPQQALAASLQASGQAANANAYTLFAPESASHHAPHHVPHLHPLTGAAVSVKALFDVQGWVTHAGSAVLRSQPAATADAPAVARLRAAGASIVGQSHMVEFAFSGVGTNPHDPTPAGLDGLWGHDLGGRYVPGGSSSGAGVSVASGSAWIGLGSDTGGSIRIPAALNGLVGFKSTTGLVPTKGTVPLSTSLDTACAITRSVRDAVLAHEVLSQRRITRSSAPLSAWRLAVPQQWMLDDLEPAVAHAFERSLGILQRAGAQITALDLPELHAITDVNAVGGLIA